MSCWERISPLSAFINSLEAPGIFSMAIPEPAKVAARRHLAVKHITHYRYDQPILRSKHCVHLRPIDDVHQSVESHRLSIDPNVPIVEFEDVFGNWASRFEITQPYRELNVAAESTITLSGLDPFAFANGPMIRPSFPLVWMPWEYMMLSPYLAPVELPETQLRELYDYAMSFVEQNNNDLMETLFAINLTLFREYKYVPDCTRLETTPYEVFASKKGVCQDFANLFICMARLLGIPARYVCGYVYTGNAGSAIHGTNHIQSDASHAWLQLYIPNAGWKGFDPTNGVLASTNHIRVAYGRHYRDVTPTAGTLYSSAKETMTVDVQVLELPVN
jgi:transglutaminase-like putative cysteine protease